jgi:hypothetical protein
MLVQMNRIISAVKSTLPASMWPGIARKLKGEDEASEPQQLACEDFHSWYQDADPGALPTLRAAIGPAVCGHSTSDPTASKKYVATRKWWPPAPSLTTSSCSGGCGRSPKNSPG